MEPGTKNASSQSQSSLLNHKTISEKAWWWDRLAAQKLLHSRGSSPHQSCWNPLPGRRNVLPVGATPSLSGSLAEPCSNWARRALCLCYCPLFNESGRKACVSFNIHVVMVPVPYTSTSPSPQLPGTQETISFFLIRWVLTNRVEVPS